MPGIVDPRERNPVTILRSYDAGAVAPHLNTIRWAYTVPANKLAIVELVVLLMTRDAAPVASGYIQLWIEVSAGGGAANILMNITEITAVVGVPRSIPLAPQLLLLPNDFIRARSVDGSNGGTYYYSAGLKATEFDI